MTETHQDTFPEIISFFFPEMNETEKMINNLSRLL